jgi:AbrB family looped-hinge helix DNA binding protein
MPVLQTTQMSTKGQVVIPEDVRNRLGLGAGSQFLVLSEDDVVILKVLTPPPMSEFDAIIRRARRQAKAAGMTRSDIARAVQARRSMMDIGQLWHSRDPQAWNQALERYWDLVQPRNREFEEALDPLNLKRIRSFDAQGWYDFLLKEYFRWKYTAANRYATTTRHLRRYVEENALGELDGIRQSLLSLKRNEVRAGLVAACAIRGLGTAGASGLLALMYPKTFGTVDQFVVKALREVGGLPEASALARMNPMSLSVNDGVLLIGILQRKAADNNRLFGTATWTPRKIDKVLWTYGR